MSIPVGRPGGLDGEGGETHGALRPRPVAYAGGMGHVSVGDRLRVWLVPDGIQPLGAVCGTGSAFAVGVAVSGPLLLAAAVEVEPRMEEQSHDADDHGADDA